MTMLSQSHSPARPQSRQRRNFTDPTASRMQRRPTQTSEEETEKTFFTHPDARLYSFTPPTSTRPSSSAALTPPSQPLKWKVINESLDGVGMLRLYEGRAQNGLMSISSNKNLALTLMPNSLWWCVDKKSVFATQRGTKIFRVELPYESEEDQEKVEQFKSALGNIVRLDDAPCPFDADSSLDPVQDGKRRRRLIGRHSEGGIAQEWSDFWRDGVRGPSIHTTDEGYEYSDDESVLGTRNEEDESFTRDPKSPSQEVLHRMRGRAEAHTSSFTAPQALREDSGGDAPAIGDLTRLSEPAAASKPHPEPEDSLQSLQRLSQIATLNSPSTSELVQSSEQLSDAVEAEPEDIIPANPPQSPSAPQPLLKEPLKTTASKVPTAIAAQSANLDTSINSNSTLSSTPTTEFLLHPKTGLPPPSLSRSTFNPPSNFPTQATELPLKNKITPPPTPASSPPAKPPSRRSARLSSKDSFDYASSLEDSDDIPTIGIVSQTLGILLGPPSGLMAVLMDFARRISSYSLMGGNKSGVGLNTAGESDLVWNSTVMMPGRWREDSEDETDDGDEIEAEDDYGVPLGNGATGRQRRKVWGSFSTVGAMPTASKKNATSDQDLD